MDYYSQIQDYFNLNNILINETQLTLLSNYAQLLKEKNEIINLISRKDTDNIIENHIFHSLLLTKYITENEFTFIDIGTGGGLPGIPIGIYYNNSKGVLVDSISKKINAVNEFIDKLNLSNIKGICTRVEDKNFIKQYENYFDVMISRAVAPLIDLIKYFLPVSKAVSKMYFLKGGSLVEEISLAKKKYSKYITNLEILNLNYKPNNIDNEKEKKIIILGIKK